MNIICNCGTISQLSSSVLCYDFMAEVYCCPACGERLIVAEMVDVMLSFEWPDNRYVQCEQLGRFKIDDYESIWVERNGERHWLIPKAA